MSEYEVSKERNNPFRSGSFSLSGAGATATKRELLQKVGELNLGREAVSRANSQVRELTVKDLNDLASEFAGVPTYNKKVAELSFDDLRNIEEVFTDFKLDIAERASLDREFDLAAVDVSCCCCTPCCCCAASVVEPATI